MLDLQFIPVDLVKSAIENFTLIATLILLYYFIPDSVHSRSKLRLSLYVGLIFGFIAVITIPSLWQAMGTPAAPFFGVDTISLASPATGPQYETLGDRILGINVILVPLSGFIAGPVASVVVTGILIAGSVAAGDTPPLMDIMTLLSGILLGALFYWCRTWDRFPKSFPVQILLLGAGFAIMDAGLLAVSSLAQVSPGGPGTLSLSLPSLIICCAGIVILGLIIGCIDRKKQAEGELHEYREHLEDLVKDRTAELSQLNSLQAATFEATADGLVVTDQDDTIRAYNRKAARILNLPDQPPRDTTENRKYTDQIVATVSDPEHVLRHFADMAASVSQEVTTSVKLPGGRQYELSVHPQEIGSRIVGRVWSLHDVTDKRMAEAALRSANSKLVLLSSITRHDILNQLSALRACVDLIRDNPGDPAVPGYLDTMEKTTEVIRLQMEFTSDYQDLGQKEPVWQVVSMVFAAAAEPFAGWHLAFSCDTGTLECYADALLGRVFYNMIDNSIRHGEHVSAVRLSFVQADPDLLIVYEDNGVGVPEEDKEKIFIKGFGKHTGLGMFLIKEILSITGMTIKETGTRGKGVRFEIRVPAGAFRFR